MELREQNARLAAEIAAFKRRLEEKERSSKTIIETARKRGKSLVSGLMDLFRSDNQASDPIPSDSASGAS